MGQRRFAVPLLAAGFLATTLGGCGQSWHSALVTVDAAGTNSGNGPSFWPTVSPDGTKLAFTSAAGDFGPTDSARPPDPSAPDREGLDWDVYLADLTTGDITLVSTNAAGTDSGNGRSWDPVFSPDGTKIAFNSSATDLGPADEGDTYWENDIYVRDLATGSIQLVTRNAAQSDGQSGWNPAFSPDSGRVVFSSMGGDYGPTDTNGTDDIYLRNLHTGAITLVSTDASGTQAASSYSSNPSFSPDGTKVVFDSHAGDFGPPDGNDLVDVYLHDLLSGTKSLVSVSAAGTNGGDGASSRAQLSPGGTKVLFESMASNLGAIDHNGAKDLYVRDLVAGTTTLVTATFSGAQAGNDTTGLYAWAGDSNRVLFDSDANDLVPNDHNVDRGDVFIRDLAAGTTTLVSVNATGTSANEHSYFQSISPDGTKVGFVSFANDFGPTDTPRPPSAHASGDIYVHDLASGKTTLVSARADGTDSANGHSSDHVPVFISDTRVAFQTRGSDLGANDTNDVDDVYIATLG